MTITSSLLAGRGDLIRCNARGINLNVYDCLGHGENPYVFGQSKGMFLKVTVPLASISVTHCYIESVASARAVYDGRKPVPGGIIFKQNIVRNLDGRPSNGRNGYLWVSRDKVKGNCIVLDHVYNSPNIAIQENEIRQFTLADNGQALAGDLIEIYSSSGTSASPIDISNNFVRDQYPSSTSESGPLCGRGVFNFDGDTSDLTAPSAYINCHDNQVVGSANGVYLFWCNNINVYDNRIVSSLRDPATGIPYQCEGEGIGLLQYHNEPFSWCQTWSIQDNIVGAMGSGANARNDFLLSANLAQFCKNDQSLTATPTQSIMLSDEDKEETIWRTKADKFYLGPWSF